MGLHRGSNFQILPGVCGVQGGGSRVYIYILSSSLNSLKGVMYGEYYRDDQGGY